MNPPPKLENPQFNDPLCSHCGLCMGNAWTTGESLESCVFNTGWLGKHEERLFGRTRNVHDEDELRFGIALDRFNAVMNKPLEGAQWSGIITAISTEALRSGLVDAVVTLQGSTFQPKAVLATTVEEIHAARGNKPVLSPVLQALHKAWKKKVKKLLVVGASCHVHVLRDFVATHPYFSDVELHVVGIPCTDNLEPAHLRWVFRHISRSPGTVLNFEFMQDYKVHIVHSTGKIEKIPFFSLPAAVLKVGVFSNSCMSCFDYINSLSDITVGYFGAPYSSDGKLQWVMVRTEKGRKLLDLIRSSLAISPETGSGDSFGAVKASIQPTIGPILQPHLLGDRRSMPLIFGKLLSALKARKGPRGIEFARYSIDIHALRNYFFVRHYTPQRLDILVPEHIRHLVQQYNVTDFDNLPPFTGK
jgi:3,8-divinyl protochlorophyllide a 8-vinyl-reductase (ferredoxin)